MKIDAMTAGAVGFAAFAAWYVLKKPKASTGQSGTDTAYASATSQRRQVGSALTQNYDYLLSDNWGNLPGMGGGQGLKPSSGFWS
jgi:hypothetical protein